MVTMTEKIRPLPRRRRPNIDTDDTAPLIEDEALAFPDDALFLCNSSSKALYYSPSMGYLARSLSKAGAWRILLGAATRFDRYPSGDDVDTPRAFIEGQFYGQGPTLC